MSAVLDPTATRTWSAIATQTALQVISWAADPVGLPPRGSLRSSVGLARDVTVRRALRELTRATAARLGAGQPAFGDPGAVGPGGILLAAALGGRERTEQAARLAALVPAPALGRSASTGWLDALARHAVVGAAVTADDPVSRACLDASPLSSVLVRPADGQPERALEAAVGLLGRPRGPEVLAAVLSVPATATGVLSWRAWLLGRLARNHPAAVAGVYSAALLQHGPEWWHVLESAELELATSVESGSPDAQAVAALQYWAALSSRQVIALGRTPELGAEYSEIRILVRRYGLDLVRAG